jgi:hypothetical protein
LSGADGATLRSKRLVTLGGELEQTCRLLSGMPALRMWVALPSSEFFGCCGLPSAAAVSVQQACNTGSSGQPLQHAAGSRCSIMQARSLHHVLHSTAHGSVKCPARGGQASIFGLLCRCIDLPLARAASTGCCRCIPSSCRCLTTHDNSRMCSVSAHCGMMGVLSWAPSDQ